MKKILTIDCDFVYDKILNEINEIIESNYIPMRARYWYLKNDEYLRDKFTPNKDRVDFINAIIYWYKVIKKVEVETILYHHDVLNFVDDYAVDLVVNIDYHKDDADDAPVLYCGNWSNLIKNYIHISEEGEDNLQMLIDYEFDKVVICFSPEWTLDVEWLSNKTIRNKLNKECIKIYSNEEDFYRY